MLFSVVKEYCSGKSLLETKYGFSINTPVDPFQQSKMGKIFFCECRF